jgi:hypothetical protein
LAKGEEYMEMYDAKMIKDGENHHLELNIKTFTLKISMTEDLPNEIKAAFNQLIHRLKIEHFNFDLGDVDTDLFSQIAKEYIGQLNKELTTIHTELAHHDLLLNPAKAE